MANHKVAKRSMTCLVVAILLTQTTKAASKTGSSMGPKCTKSSLLSGQRLETGDTKQILRVCLPYGQSQTWQQVPQRIVIGAASDLVPAFTEIGKRFKKRSLIDISFSFDSSGRLSQQIVNGANFDGFASASNKFVDTVMAQRGKEFANPNLFATGKLVLYSQDSSLTPKAITDLTSDKYKKIVIADPNTAPFGAAAVQALTKAGVYDKVKPKLVLASNITDAFGIAKSGNAQASLVSASQVIANNGTYNLVDPKSYEPLTLTLISTTGGNKTGAQAFSLFISTPQSRALFTSLGYDVPAN